MNCKIYYLIICLCFLYFPKTVLAQDTPTSKSLFNYASSSHLRDHLSRKSYMLLEKSHLNREAIIFFQQLDYTQPLTSKELTEAKQLLQNIEKIYRDKIKEINTTEKKNYDKLEANKDQLGEQAVEEYYDSPQHTMWRVKTNKNGDKIRVKDYAEINKVKREALEMMRKNIEADKLDALRELQYWKSDCTPKNLPPVFINLFGKVDLFYNSTIPFADLSQELSTPNTFIFVNSFLNLPQEDKEDDETKLKKPINDQHFYKQFQDFLNNDVFQVIPDIELFIKDGTNTQKQEEKSFLQLFKLISTNVPDSLKGQLLQAQKIYTERHQLVLKQHKDNLLIMNKRYKTKELQKLIKQAYTEQNNYLESSKIPQKLSNEELAETTRLRHQLIANYHAFLKKKKGSSYQIKVNIHQHVFSQSGDYQLITPKELAYLSFSFKNKELLPCEKEKLFLLLQTQAYQVYNSRVQKLSQFSYSTLQNIEKKILEENWKKLSLFKDILISEKDFLFAYRQKFLPAIFQLEILFSGWKNFYKLPQEWQLLLFDTYYEKNIFIKDLKIYEQVPEFITLLIKNEPQNAISAYLKAFPQNQKKLQQWLKLPQAPKNSDEKKNPVSLLPQDEDLEKEQSLPVSQKIEIDTENRNLSINENKKEKNKNIMTSKEKE